MTRKAKDHRIGKRVEIGAHFDLWMRGAKYGTVRRVYNTNRLEPNVTMLAIRMDHPQVKRLFRCRETDVQRWL